MKKGIDTAISESFSDSSQFQHSSLSETMMYDFDETTRRLIEKSFGTFVSKKAKEARVIEGMISGFFQSLFDKNTTIRDIFIGTEERKARNMHQILLVTKTVSIIVKNINSPLKLHKFVLDLGLKHETLLSNNKHILGDHFIAFADTLAKSIAMTYACQNVDLKSKDEKNSPLSSSIAKNKKEVMTLFKLTKTEYLSVNEECLKVFSKALEALVLDDMTADDRLDGEELFEAWEKVLRAIGSGIYYTAKNKQKLGTFVHLDKSQWIFFNNGVTVYTKKGGSDRTRFVAFSKILSFECTQNAEIYNVRIAYRSKSKQQKTIYFKTYQKLVSDKMMKILDDVEKNKRQMKVYT